MSAPEERKTPAIGVDLGTTFSCVAVWQNGKADIIANSQGARITPSYVSFTERERLFGDAAKEEACVNPENTIFDAKRLIGRKFEDEMIQKDLELWPFKVEDDDGKPKVVIDVNGKVDKFDPEQISAMVLKHMKEIAETFLNNQKVTDAVITVPAYFNDSQRQATKDAGTIAGLNVLRVLNEPTAAALAYGFEKKIPGKQNVLIFDLGGGTFDVSILTIEHGSKFNVLATAGHPHLGGEDFDECLVDYFAEEFERKHKKSLKGNSRALSRLRSKIEQAKRALSSSNETKVVVDAIMDGIDFQARLSRARFEEICENLFQDLIGPLDEAFAIAKLQKEQIDEVVLVGGSSRIPKVQSLLQEYFNGKELNQTIHPDEAVAYGAALQAHLLVQEANNIPTPETKDLVLIDRTPFSLGLETKGGIMVPIIKRNSVTPCESNRTFSTSTANQATVAIKVYEGERKFTKDNNLLGVFELTGIAPAPAGVPQIVVSFSLNEDNILTITAKEGNKETNYVVENKERLSPDDIDRMMEESSKYEEIDEHERKRIAERSKLEKFALAVRSAAESVKGSLADAPMIISEALAILDWVDDSLFEEKQKYTDRIKALEDLIRPFSALKVIP